MKRYFRSLLLFSFFILSLCVLTQPVKAQFGPPEGEVVDPDSPVDGGICILVAVGVGYGMKKIRRERKNKLHNLPKG